MARQHYYSIILSPGDHRKVARCSPSNNQVVFKVASDATKPQIKEAVEALFDVKVKAVNTLVHKGKTKRSAAALSRADDKKKRIVTLAEGERIDVTTGL